MGLAGPKERTKLARDPRNTFWSNDTSRFGHRYLSSLGWAPGSTLGDTSSEYHQAGHVTEASSTGVKIALKDDTLGIGAKRSADDECVGLLGLQGLLGRLNGDEKAVENVQREEKRRKDEWIHARYGMQFVRGETWRSSDIEKLREQMMGEKKRKREAQEGNKIKDEESRSKKSKSKSKKKAKAEREESTSTAPSEEEVETKPKKKSKDKKSKREKSKEKEDGESEPKSVDKHLVKPAESAAASSDSESGSKSKRLRTRDTDKAKSDKPKKKKSKDKERSKKEEKRSKDKKDKKEKKSKKSKKRRKEESEESSSSEAEETTTTAEASRATSGTSTPVAAVLTGRHAIRSRYIAAKRSAMMDPRALNEILMIKA